MKCMHLNSTVYAWKQDVWWSLLLILLCNNVIILQSVQSIMTFKVVFKTLVK